MTDHDDKLTRLYRSLAREEPSAALDTAILAASRRAPAHPSASRRWAMPVSVAAVLVLAVGVTLRMQQEQPGIETAVPANEYSQPAAVPETTPTPSAPSGAPPRASKAEGELRSATPAQKPKEKLSRPRGDSGVREAEKFQPAPARDSFAKEEAQAIRAEPKPFADAPAKSAAPPPSEPAAAAAPPPAAAQSFPRAATSPAPTAPAAAAPQTAGALPSPPLGALPRASKAEGELPGFAPRAKREGAADSARALQSAPLAATEQERELDRIARLRVEGRHGEADKALEEFRRKYPDYRIPEAMWERVRARQETR
jgi:hypothetical protein